MPASLVQASAIYRRNAWLAVAGLAGFILIYVGVCTYLVWNTLHLLFGSTDSANPLGNWIFGLTSGFLALFMLKGLIFKTRGKVDLGQEITAADQPELFAFLYRLADEAKAPRPYRVFLTDEVNAHVFYDVSLLNLIFPSRKNLTLGLALVNVLTLSELKAVCAHEFGHFAQRSMAVGRWVYMAQQVAMAVVRKRDALDKFLNGLCHIDIRLAWIGWVLRLIVWAIRCLVETLSRLVELSQRALSRQMEFQADLVAVALSGSDALIHGLQRLPVAEDAWARARVFANTQIARGCKPSDLFTVQTRMIEHMRAMLNDPAYGVVPPVPAQSPEQYRLIKADLAHPPRMWSTHPYSHEREENAKRVYVAAGLDDRSAWTLFQQASALRERMTTRLLGEAKGEPQTEEESLAALAQYFEHEAFDPEYRGAYIGRNIARHANNVDELYNVGPVVGELYPESLPADLARLRELIKEKAQLEALRERVLETSDGLIRYRGQIIRRRALPGVIASVDTELKALQQQIHDHDCRCRTFALSRARALGTGWDGYLRGLLALIHYCEHGEARLRDGQTHFRSIVYVETRTGRVTEQGLNNVLRAGNLLHADMDRIFKQAGMVTFDSVLQRELGVANLAARLGKFGFATATRQNIGEWERNVHSWVDHLANTLSDIGTVALDELLRCEKAFRGGEAMGPAPSPSVVDAQFQRLLPGQERPPQKTSAWVRFQTAEGAWHGVLRFVAASAILGCVLGFSVSVGENTLYIYNGLERTVLVKVAGQQITVNAMSVGQLSLKPCTDCSISATTEDGRLIENATLDIQGAFNRYFYNVAQASPLVEWTQTYGNGSANAPRKLGLAHSGTVSAEVPFADPPSSISSQTGGGTRTVLNGFANKRVIEQLGILDDDNSRQLLALAHVRWDPADAPQLMEWMTKTDSAQLSNILQARLRDDPQEVISWRMYQDLATPTARREICKQLDARYQQQPKQSNLLYLRLRCQSDIADVDQGFIAAAGQYPDNPWLALGAGYAYADQQQWPKALDLLQQARTSLPTLRSGLDVDIARIYRRQGDLPADLAQQLSQESSPLAILLLPDAPPSSEEGELHSLANQDWEKPYNALAQGDLQQAMAAASKLDADQQAFVLRIVAASRSAPAALVKQALELPLTRGLNESSLWSSFALAQREKRDVTPYLAFMNKHNLGSLRRDKLLTFIRQLDQHVPPEQAEQTLRGLDPQYQGFGYSIGCILLGQAAPASWRERAKQLLFVAERPYFD